jgi:hypothetical protein
MHEGNAHIYCLNFMTSNPGILHGAARHGMNFLGVFPSRVSGEMKRAAAGAQSIPPRIGQNTLRPIFFTAPRDLERLVEE